MKKHGHIPGLAVLCICLFNACTPQWLFQQKDIPYSGPPIVKKESYEHILKSDDKVIISIWGHDELGVGSTFSVFSSTLEQGKFISIDAKGEVTLPLIGNVKIEGLTAREANLYLTRLYAKFIKDPIIYLRVLSLNVTVLGEVVTPGTYTIDKERKNLVEIIGDAGGFGPYADKSRVRIMRTHPDDYLEEITFDLTDRDIFFTQDLGLRSDDIVYVPERRAKEFEKVVSSKLVPVVGAIGSMALILSIINNLQGSE